MATLDELMRAKGVIAAGEFTDDGRLVSYKGNIPQDQAEMTAQFCGTVNMMFKTLSAAYEKITGMRWTPAQGWAFAGGDYSVCIGGNRGAFVETAKADYNQLFGLLVGSRPGA
ncbi:MAG: DUF2173 family protein [Nitrospira sp.]|nr:DUF2173 family protein [Nitrospira sp.]